MEKVRLAEIIATGAHYGQVDKGGKEYINHPATVAMYVESEDEKIVAWLHDTVEDTDITLDDVESWFGFKIRQAVDAITRRTGEDRQEYLNRVSKNKLATQVKLADLKHNSDLSRITQRPIIQKDRDRANRYQKESEFLRGIINNGS